MKRIALCLLVLTAVAACGTPPSSSDAAPGDARFDGRQNGSGNVTDPADTTDTGTGTGMGG